MNNRKQIKIVTIFCAVLLGICLFIFPLSGCKKTLSRTFFTADTVCQITLYDGNEEILDKAVDRVHSLSAKLDAHSPESALSKLNAAGGGEYIDDDLLAVLGKGLSYSRQSKGVLDITIEPVTSLWDFKEGVVPDAADIKSALQRVDYSNVRFRSGGVDLGGCRVELGAIAKGYMADKVIDFLLENGVTSAIVNLGGNVAVLGKHGSRSFSVGIQKPFEKETIATVLVSNGSVVTSGTYQRCFVKNGRNYHHLLSTKTGYPVENSLTSVTVLAPHSIDADALSTLCFLYGKEKGLNYINSIPDIEAVFIDENNQIFLSEGLSITADKTIRFS